MTYDNHRLGKAPLRQLLLVAVALMSTSCSSHDNSSNNSTSVAKDRWNWEQAPEASRVYIVNAPARTDGKTDMSLYQSGSRRRCWQKPNGYDCLYVSGAGDAFDAKRYHITELNQNYEDDHTLDSFTGYNCKFFPEIGVIEESIAGSQQTTLTKNTVALKGQMPNSKPWTADFVEGYLTDNGIKATGTHFDCVELAAQMMNGSLDTLTSTSVRYDQLMR